MNPREFCLQLTALQPTLLLFTKRFVKNHQDSKDLVQETMLKALRYQSSFRENKNLAGWLFIIMRNIFINQHRKRSVSQPDIHLETTAVSRFAGRSFHTADEQTYVDEVWRGINAIKSNLARPFTMHMSGYKYEEIASRLKLPVGTVKSRIFLAKQEIRNQLAGYR